MTSTDNNERSLSASNDSDLPPRPNVDASQDVQRVFAATGVFLAIVTIMWFVFYSVYAAFPYVKPGSDLVVEAKIANARQKPLFDETIATPIKIVVVGNSRVLSGFNCKVFNETCNGLIPERVVSYNMGVPGRDDPVSILADVLHGGTRPTHVLFQLPWRGPEISLTWRKSLQQDRDFINRIFPFRQFPRNLALFAIQSRKRGGLAKAYAFAREEGQLALSQDGYYFIAAQSHYPNHRLPIDFALPSDSPDTIHDRHLSLSGPEFQQLQQMQTKYGFEVILIPDHFREHSYRTPPSINEQNETQLAGIKGFSVAGPDYWRYPSDLFADPTHLNPDGAVRYSEELATLLAPVLRGH